MHELKELRKNVAVLQNKVEKLEKKSELNLPFEPELMLERMERRKDKMVEGRNEKVMNPFEENQRKMRKLEERLEEAEEDIEKIKAVLNMKGEKETEQ